MPISKYQKRNKDKLKEKAKKLYRQGLTTREVGKIIGKSHEWVAKSVKEKLTGLDK